MTAPADPATRRLARGVLGLIAAYTLVLLAVAAGRHPTPLYTVETDLVGEYIPAAQALAAGRLTADHWSYKGPGYPLLLAAAAPVFGGDFFLAARALSALAAGLSVWLAFRMVLGFAGPRIACFTAAAMAANPTLARYGIEAGTDAPALALALAATWGVLRAGTAAPLAAGLAAGWAVVTRYNTAFLIPAGLIALAMRRAGPRALLRYAACAALPVGIWMVVNGRLTGDPLHNRNYLNIAYELYGRTLPWDQFEARIGSRFGSLLDVIAFDPPQAAWRTAVNLVLHLGRDLVELAPPWLGAPALAGLVLTLRRRAWRPAWIHAGLCALTLAPVFYSSRFSLYLLPFYLAAAGACGAALFRVVARRLAGDRPEQVAAARAWGLGVAASLVALSAAAAVVQVRSSLAQAPHETRLAGLALARRAAPGDRILARKPHVAYFARMGHVPMGPPCSLHELLARARAGGARYLFYSPIEQVLRPEYAVLGDSATRLPGLEQVAYARTGPRHFYAVYRIGAPVDSAVLGAALDRALAEYVERHRLEPEAQVLAAVQLIEAGRHREALAHLLRVRAIGAKDAGVARLLSTAYLGSGAYERAYRECARAMRLERPTAWHHARLGAARALQGRHAEARDHYRRALRIEPGNIEHLERLGLAHAALGEFVPAAAVFEKCVRLAPRDARLRRFAVGALQLAGDVRSARALLDEGARLGIPLQQLLDPEAPAAATTADDSTEARAGG